MVGDEDEDGGGDGNADVNDNFYDVEKNATCVANDRQGCVPICLLDLQVRNMAMGLWPSSVVQTHSYWTLCLSFFLAFLC